MILMFFIIFNMADLIKGTGSLPVFPSSTITSRFGQLGAFDLDMALEGNAIVINRNNNPSYFPDSGTENKIIPYVLNFKESTNTRAAAQYEGLLDGVKYYFDADGYCYTYDTNGNVIQFEDYQLWMLKDNIDISSGSGAGTRGDTDESNQIAITSLLPREQIANYALEAILSTLEDPLSMDDAKINYISDLAHKIGFNMTQVASQYRKRIGEQPPGGGDDTGLDQEAETTDQKIINEIRKILNKKLDEINKTLSTGLASIAKAIIDADLKNADRVDGLHIDATQTVESYMELKEQGKDDSDTLYLCTQ